MARSLLARTLARLVVPALGASVLLHPTAAGALETIRLRLPLLDTDFVIRVSELRSPGSLLAGHSDLADLDRASGGAIGRRLIDVMRSNLPLELHSVLRQAQGSPLLDQVLLMVGAFGEIDALPDPLDRAAFLEAMERAAAANGGISLLDVLEQLPGKAVTLELARVGDAMARLRNQRRLADAAMAAQQPVSSSGRFLNPGPSSTQRREVTIAVGHRAQPLSVVIHEPGGSGGRQPNRLVVISHGLWDDPGSFEGWAEHLVSHGYTVVLPRHPGSDASQQRAMLSGRQPPPSPQELALRPRDVSAVIDVAARNQLGLRQPVNSRAVLVAGHSWGATTALQLAGARPTTTKLRALCDDVRHPSRNLSWVLQCNFVGSADAAALADPRVVAAVAVSPPMRLLFDQVSAQAMGAPVLVVSGISDWVVPPGPEAMEPVASALRSGAQGHRLVLVQGGDHFNLRAPRGAGGGPLRGLLLAWFNAIAPAAAGQPLGLPPEGWGSASHPLRDVTAGLSQIAVQPILPSPAPGAAP